MRTFFGVMGVGRLHVETSWHEHRPDHHYLPLGRYGRNYDRVVGMSTLLGAPGGGARQRVGAPGGAPTAACSVLPPSTVVERLVSR
jgi:hypothetical protein